MSTFDDALAITLSFEGGVADNPDDPGGLTAKGITQSLYDTCCRMYGWPLGLVSKATGAQIRTIYQDQFWKPARCDVMPNAWAIAAFDFAVNSSPADALIGVQVSLKLCNAYQGKIDGEVGPATIAAMQKCSATALLDHRAGFHHAEWVDHPKLITFMNGWLNRDAVLRSKILEMSR
jgi:lysozyme family protein